MDLQTFVKNHAGSVHRWGELDCGLWLADWAVAHWGVPDPAADVRGTYTTPEGALEACGAAGYVRFVDRLAKSIGLCRTRSPLSGDIAILRDSNGHPVGAIRSDEGWFYLPMTGLGFVKEAHLVMGWGR